MGFPDEYLSENKRRVPGNHENFCLSERNFKLCYLFASVSPVYKAVSDEWSKLLRFCVYPRLYLVYNVIDYTKRLSWNPPFQFFLVTFVVIPSGPFTLSILSSLTLIRKAFKFQNIFIVAIISSPCYSSLMSR